MMHFRMSTIVLRHHIKQSAVDIIGIGITPTAIGHFQQERCQTSAFVIDDNIIV